MPSNISVKLTTISCQSMSIDNHNTNNNLIDVKLVYLEDNITNLCYVYTSAVTDESLP